MRVFLLPLFVFFFQLDLCRVVFQNVFSSAWFCFAAQSSVCIQPASVVYKCFSVDLKLVGISYLGAFLITNGLCVMMPIMSVVQQGGCNPSRKLMLEQQGIYPPAFRRWRFAVSHATYLCLFPGFCSCSRFKWFVWVSQQLYLLSSVVSFPPSLSSCLLPVEPRLQVD